MGHRKIIKASAIISALSGAVILLSVIFSIVSYNNQLKERYPVLISPVPEEREKVKLEKVDYTKASNWFVGGASEEDFVSSSITFYTLSIPKLGIEKASVAIGGEDLSKNLIHYPGTAFPGKSGNAVIFGHSALPLFFNPKNYLTIFSTLPSLAKGDEIEVSYDGVLYKYKVEDMFEVKPTDIQILEQDTSDSFLTLVTCTPPGDPRKPRRLIVRARVVPLRQANADIGN